MAAILSQPYCVKIVLTVLLANLSNEPFGVATHKGSLVQLV